ncbi:MAG: condensation domain-containing protein, partial [Streptosporangiaceae bacterium]
MSESPFTDVLPLAPLQEGLLFHNRSGPAADPYIVQIVVRIEGPLKPGRLRAAAQRLTERHTGLRAGFLYDGLSRPVQVIPWVLTLPWRAVELAADGTGTCTAALDELARTERRRGFDLRRPPALRFVLAWRSQAEHWLILTHHHIIMDGWSQGLFIRDLFELYRHGDDGRPPEQPEPGFRDLLVWIQRQDHGQALQAWRSALQGFRRPTLVSAALGRARTGAVPGSARDITMVLSGNVSAGLARISRDRGLTLGTLVQGAWGLLLGQVTGSSDVVFGATVAGRHPEIARIDSAIGLCANTVPVRVAWQPGDTVSSVLNRLQSSQRGLMRYDFVSLSEIHGALQMRELFDTVVVVANYPPGASLGDLDVAGLRVSAAITSDYDHYPLGLVVVPGDPVRVQIDFWPGVIDEAAARMAGRRLTGLLAAVAADPDAQVSQAGLPSAAERNLLGRWNDTARD